MRIRIPGRTSPTPRHLRVGLALLFACVGGTWAQHLAGPAFPTGGREVRAVTAADLDADGKPDVITANHHYGDVSLLLADDACGWSLAAMHPVGGGAIVVRVADLDSDGAPDIVAASSTSDGVTILWGDGQGGVDASTHPTYGYIDDLAVVDVTADGHLDIVMVHGTYEMSIQAGDGARGFSVGPALVPESTPVQMDVGDLDGNGHPDIVTVRWFPPGALTVYLADGGGGFAPGIEYATGTSSGWSSDVVKILDLDEDGAPDLITRDGGSGVVTWLRGDGTGRFAAPVELPGVLPPGFLADLNEDGHLDILAPQLAGVQVQLSDGAGGFLPPQEFHGADAYESAWKVGAAVADMNADGHVDLLVTGQEVLTVLPGDGTGAFGQVPVVADFSAYGLALTGGVFADVNGDGDPDLLGVDGADQDRVVTVLSDGAGGFQDPVRHDVWSSGPGLAAGDVNGDGHADMAVSILGGIQLMLADGTGSFRPPLLYDTGAPNRWAILADANGDGSLDIVAGGKIHPSLVLLLGDGAGGFSQAGIIHPTETFDDAQVAELNGDGFPDLVAGAGIVAPSLWVFYGTGGFTYPTFTTYSLGLWGDIRHVLVEDLDQDGNQDVVVIQWLGFSVLMGDGAGGFLAPTFHYSSVATGDGDAALADLDGDGMFDLMLKPEAYHSVVLRLGDGAGGFGDEMFFDAGGSPEVIGVFDLTGDGAVDAVIAGGAATPTIRVVANMRGPWIECLGGVAGTNGLPHLAGAGPLIGGQDVTLTLQGALANATAWLVVGGATKQAPLFGGVLIPRLDQLFGPLTTDPTGQLLLTGPVPPGLPPGAPLSMQYWIPDPAGPAGWSASNAIVGIAP